MLRLLSMKNCVKSSCSGDEIEYLNLKISVIETESHRATFVKVEVFPEELEKPDENDKADDEE